MKLRNLKTFPEFILFFFASRPPEWGCGEEGLL
jgi:hypothetical protein